MAAKHSITRRFFMRGAAVAPAIALPTTALAAAGDEIDEALKKFREAAHAYGTPWGRANKNEAHDRRGAAAMRVMRALADLITD